MSVRRLAAVLLAIILGVAQPAVAQRHGAPKGLEVVSDAATRSGFWGNLGIGYGTEKFSVDPAAADPGWLGRGTLDIRAGGTLDPHLRLGAELVSWFDEEGNISQTLGGLAAVAQLYPSPTLGFFLKGGGGYAWNWFQDNFSFYGRTISYDAGLVWTAGGGWEIPLSSKLHLVPTVDYYGFDFGGRFTPDNTERLWNYSVAIQIH
jgi:hypothetical protein